MNYKQGKISNKKVGCKKGYTDVFDNLIREITLHLPKLTRLGYVMQGMSQLQILSLMIELFYNIHTMKGNTLDNTFIFVLKSAFDFINFRNIFDYHNVNMINSVVCSIIILYYISLFLTSVIFGIFILFDKSFYEWISIIWGHICIWHHSVICTPIFAYSVKCIIEFRNGELVLYTENNPGLIGIVVILILGGAFSIISAIIMSKLCYHQLKVKDSTAMKNSHLQVITLLFKIMMTPILALPISYVNSCLGVSLASIAITIRTILIVQHLPFYNFRMADYYTAWNTMIMDVALIALFSLTIDTYINLSPESYILCTIVIFFLHAKIAQNIIDAKLLNAATLPYSKITSDSQIVLKWLYIKRLIRKGAPNIFLFKKIIHYELFLQGLLMNHCENEGRIFLKEFGLEDLFDKNFKKLGELSSENYDQVTYIIRRLVLEVGIQKFPNSHLIRLLMVQYIIDRTDAYHQSIFILNDLKNRSQSLETKNSIAQLEKKMEAILESKCYVSDTSNNGKVAKEINILKLIQNEEIYAALNDELQKQTKSHLKLWGLFIENEPKIREVYNLAAKIHRDNVVLQVLWERLLANCQRSQPKIFLLYGLFNLIVKNRNIYGEDLLKTYTNIMKNTHNENLSDELTSDNILAFDNIVILVSGQKESVGVIKTITHSIEKHLGMTRDNLKRANITVLMSPYFQKQHNNFMLNYYETGASEIFKKHKTIYLMHCDGHIIPCNIIIKYSPNISNGVEYFSLIRPFQSKKNLLLVTQEGILDACTKEIADMLNMKRISKKNFLMNIICPNFDEINYAINAYESMKLMKELKKERDEIMAVRTKVANYKLKKNSNNDSANYNNMINNYINTKRSDDDKNLESSYVRTDINNNINTNGNLNTYINTQQNLISHNNNKISLNSEEFVSLSKHTEQNMPNTKNEFQDYIMETEEKAYLSNDFKDLSKRIYIQKTTTPNYNTNNLRTNNKFPSTIGTPNVNPNTIINIYNSNYCNNNKNVKAFETIDYPQSLSIRYGDSQKIVNKKKTKIFLDTGNQHMNKYKLNKKKIKDLYEKYVLNGDILEFLPFGSQSDNDKIKFFCKIDVEVHQKTYIFKSIELKIPNFYNGRSVESKKDKQNGNESIFHNDKSDGRNTDSDIVPVKHFLNKPRNENPDFALQVNNSSDEEEKINAINDSFEDEFPIDLEKENSNHNMKITNMNLGPKHPSRTARSLLLRAKIKSSPVKKPERGQWFFEGPVPDNKDPSSNQTKALSQLKENQVEQILANKREKKARRKLQEEDNTSYNSTNQTKSSHFIMMKIETALDEDFQANSLSFIYYGTIIFYLTCILLLIVVITYDIIGIRSMANKREIIEAANFRVDSLNEIYRNTKNLYENLTDQINYSWITDQSIITNITVDQTTLSIACSTLALYNSNLRNLLYEIDPKLKDLFYSLLVKLFDFDDTGYKLDSFLEQNVFDGVLDIVTKCFNLANVDWAGINLKYNDIMYILRNSINDLLIGVENSVSILAQDIDISMDTVLTTNLGFLMSMSFCIMGLFILLGKHIHSFNLERETFFQVLLKIDILDLRIIHMRLIKFEEILKKNYQDNDLISFFNILQKNNSDKTGKRGDPNRKHARTAQFTGLNRKNLIVMLATFLLVSTIFTVFSTIYIELKIFDETRKLQIAKSNFAAFSLIRYGQVLTSLSEYVSENKTTTMRNKNISPVLVENLNNLNFVKDMLNQFTDANGDIDPDFSFYLIENFCLFGDPLQKQFCNYIDKAPVQMGIVGINNYIISKVLSIKNNFDISQHTSDDIKSTLNSNDYFNINALYDIYLRDAYINISSILKINFRLEIQKVENTLLVLTACFFLLIILATILSKLWIYDILREQGNSLKAILKLVPFNLLLSNNALKFYLIRTSKKILQSLKFNI